jgi:exosortase/archaeosortase family protein
MLKATEAGVSPLRDETCDPRCSPHLLRRLPVRFTAAMVLALAFVVFLTVDQSHWWRLRPDYAFGWLVPLLAAYVVAERLPRVAALFRTGGSSPLPRWARACAAAMAVTVLSAGLLVFLIGAIYRAGDGPSQPGSLALAFGFAGILLGMVYWTAPEGSVSAAGAPGLLRSIRRDARLRATALFLFPALVWMISAPLASAVENAVSLFLLRKVVAVVFAVFSGLGLPLIQEGNVLILPHGQVGVADACSGIRSLTGCLFAGSFLAAVYLDRFWKKVLLVAAAMGFAFLTNLLRSLFLTSWAYAYGSNAIEGTLHDATGFAVLGLTSIGLFCLLPLFRSRRPASGSAEAAG